MTDTINEDDPHDDITDWLGNLPKAPTDSAQRSTECDTGGPEQPFLYIFLVYIGVVR